MATNPLLTVALIVFPLVAARRFDSTDRARPAPALRSVAVRACAAGTSADPNPSTSAPIHKRTTRRLIAKPPRSTWTQASHSRSSEYRWQDQSKLRRARSDETIGGVRRQAGLDRCDRADPAQQRR